MKICTKCKENKELKEYHNDINGVLNKKSHCKACISNKDKEKYSTFSDNKKVQLNTYNKTNYANRTEKQKERRRKVRTKQHVNRYAIDTIFRLKCILRSRLNAALKGDYKSGSAVDNLGCSIEEFKIYIENQFEPWMNWDNHGLFDKDKLTWQLDHINALANIDLTDNKEFLKVIHHTNYQPLLAIKNIKKSNK